MNTHVSTPSSFLLPLDLLCVMTSHVGPLLRYVDLSGTPYQSFDSDIEVRTCWEEGSMEFEVGFMNKWYRHG